MNNWLAFYNPHFTSQDKAKRFVESCENHPSNVAKTMLHQVQRLVSLSDDMQKIRPNDESLKLLFLIMCVENVAKLHDGYSGEFKSWYYVEKFFKDFLSDDDKDLLRNGFTDNNDKWLRSLSFDDVIKMLYKIRCDVVHEGNYTDFSFYDGKTEMLNIIKAFDVIPHVTLQNIRDVIIRGCIKAIQSKL
jgi:hypothetical protein